MIIFFCFRGANIADDEPKRFDKLTPDDTKQFIAFINSKYRKAMCNCQKSGNHGDFHNYVQNTPWLYLYHIKLEECGVEMQSLAKSEPEPDVFYSSNNIMSSTNSSNSSTGSGKSRSRGGNSKSDTLKAFLMESERKTNLLFEKNKLMFESSLREKAQFNLQFRKDITGELSSLREKLCLSKKKSRGIKRDLISVNTPDEKEDMEEELHFLNVDIEMYGTEIKLLSQKLNMSDCDQNFRTP